MSSVANFIVKVEESTERVIRAGGLEQFQKDLIAFFARIIKSNPKDLQVGKWEQISPSEYNVLLTVNGAHDFSMFDIYNSMFDVSKFKKDATGLALGIIELNPSLIM